MTLAELLNGHSVFIDSNIFIYHFGGPSPQCKAFLERCACRELPNVPFPFIPNCYWAAILCSVKLDLLSLVRSIPQTAPFPFSLV